MGTILGSLLFTIIVGLILAKMLTSVRFVFCDFEWIIHFITVNEVKLFNNKITAILQKAQFFFLALAGTGTFAYFLGWVTNNLSFIIGSHLRYVLTYVGVTSLISFSICYIHGPILNPRALHVLQWLLQGLSLVLVYQSVAYEPYGMTICAMAFLSGLIEFLCDSREWVNAMIRNFKTLKMFKTILLNVDWRSSAFSAFSAFSVFSVFSLPSKCKS